MLHPQPPKLDPKGNTASTINGKLKAVACLNAFLHQEQKYRCTMDALPVHMVCDQDLWLEFAHYLLNTHTATTGDPVKGGTVVEYLRKALGVARDKFGQHQERKYREFFEVLDRPDDPRNWLKGAIRQVYVARFQEATAKGEEVAKQAWPIYTTHRRDISKALRKCGTLESIERNLVIQINGVAAGRPGEIATLSVDVMTWDPLLHCVRATWPQIKTHKQKIIAFTAGVDRWLCPINSFACAFAAGLWQHSVYSDDSLNPLFPKLSKSKSVTCIISQWLDQLVAHEKNTNKAYSAYRVPSLSSEITASGQRVGSLNEMAAGGVCAEFNAAVSGHDLEQASRLWTYLRVETPVLIPGVTVLGGWPGLPYAQLGAGPKTASWQPLLDNGSVTEATMDSLTDAFLHLNRDLSPPCLFSTGELRGFALAMSATLVMYYEPSVIAGEVTTVTCHMRNVMSKVGVSALHAADEMLRKWGAAIKAQFDMDNLHLTCRTSSETTEHLVASVQQMASMVSGLQQSSNSGRKVMERQLSVMEDAIEGLQGQVSSVVAMLTTRAPRSPAKNVTPAPRSPGKDRTSVSAPSTQPRDATPSTLPRDATSSAALVESSDSPQPDNSASVSSDSSGSGKKRPPAAPQEESPPKARMLQLQWLQNAAPLVTKLKGLSAVGYIKDFLAGRVTLRASDVTRGQLALNCFRAVASPEEKLLLTRENTIKNSAQVTTLLHTLHDRVVGRMIKGWREHGEGRKPPKCLLAFKELTVNSVSDRLSEMDSAMPGQWKTKLTTAMTAQEAQDLPQREQ
eukprot:CAMPEP_0181299616 /NCGR_PEP_ID=MMETSP1101-20121128/6444_1 /TAXON_ID=46948 /ORGANISM="Rhodomonas abbreviata, Strain Caron Lab Isolate" /LENGTH=793 /DNA_ID=CAMNT_0023404783 /DNA_START=565 /DNA_END=2946 /DNA_ORIENTATION=+